MKQQVTNNYFDGSDPAINFGAPSGIYKTGWQLVVTGLGSVNGDELDVTVYGGHTVEGVTQYVELHKATLVAADFVKPDGTTEGAYVHLLIQDPWGKYDDIRVRITGIGGWEIRSSLRTGA